MTGFDPLGYTAQAVRLQKNMAQGATIDDGMIKSPDDSNHLRTFGFLVLRQFFDPAALSAEMDRVLKDAFSSSAAVSRYDGNPF